MVNGACPHRKASLQVNKFTSLMWYYSNYHVQRMSKFISFNGQVTQRIEHQNLLLYSLAHSDK